MTAPEITLTGDALTGVGPRPMFSPVAALPRTVKLGCVVRPAPVKALRFGDFFDAGRVTSPPPASTNRRAKAAASLGRMYRNDVQGCCVISGKAHNLGLWGANDSDSGGEVQATDAEIDSQYQHLKVGPGDSGCIIRDVLEYCRTAGFLAGGRRYKIDGYVSADWTNKLQVQTAINAFGATTIGFMLPAAWANQAVWDVTDSPTVGGHDVSPVDYDERGVYVSSWGRVYLMTWAAFLSRRWVTECWAMLAPLWYGPDKLAPVGVDAVALKSALDAIGKGQVPDIGGGPPPAPVAGFSNTGLSLAYSGWRKNAAGEWVADVAGTFRVIK